MERTRTLTHIFYKILCGLTFYDTPLVRFDTRLAGQLSIFWVQLTIHMTCVVNVTCVYLHTYGTKS